MERTYRTKETLISSVKKHIEPENQEGNREYKLNLADVPPEKINRVSSQMRYRLTEGNGECYYNIGILDDGGVVGVTEEEYEKTLNILKFVAEKNSYYLREISREFLDEEKSMAEFLIREHNPKKYIDLKVACAGNVDSGKSSLLGVLLSGKADNGRGSARLSVFNFVHEIKSGKTSSVAQHILGFTKEGECVNYIDSLGRKKNWPEIVSRSSKIVTFFDLCGHEKYLKTTIRGLTSQSPDLVFILVGGNMGVSKMTKEHIFLCLSLNIPFCIIITKIDMMESRPDVFRETIDTVKKLLKSPFVNRVPLDIKNGSDVVLASKITCSLQTTPIFYISNTTEEGISLLKDFLNLYSKKKPNDVEKNRVEMHIDTIFQVQGVGTVIGGQLLNGKIKCGDKLLIGPQNNSYYSCHVRSIHCKRVSVEEVEEGSYVCLGIKKPESLILRKGLVCISPTDKPICIKEFTALVSVLKSNSSTIGKGYSPVLHSHGVRQSARIEEITQKECSRGKDDGGEYLRTGDKGIVRFRFLYNSEFIKVGWRILLAEGGVKIIGKILTIVEILGDVV